MSGRNPPLYCTLTLLAMQGHQKNSKTIQKQCSTPLNNVVIIYYYIGCKYTAHAWYLTGFPKVTLGQQYNVGEKPTIILYTYINPHAELPNITNQDNIVQSQENST